VHDALNEPTAYAVADRILRRTAEFLTEGRSQRGCMTIQAALAGGVEGEPIRRKLIALRVKEHDALRRRFERAKSEGDLPNDADCRRSCPICHCPLSGLHIRFLLRRLGRSLSVLDGLLAFLVFPGPHDIDCSGVERGLDVRRVVFLDHLHASAAVLSDLVDVGALH